MAFFVSGMNLRPWRCEEDAPVIAVRCGPTEGGLAGQVLKRRGGVDESPVEEDPPGHPPRILSIGQGNCDRSACEGRSIDPGQARAVAGEFLADDASAGFFDNRVATARQLREER